jgi:hypothetical protein
VLPRDDRFLKRVFEYAVETHVLVKKTACRRDALKLGLPDLRGFSPHLRTVNLFADSTFSFEKIKSEDFFNTPEYQWLVHDLLHIIFYDFAALNLGVGFWNDRDRFYECHLASELFAVLALDYHFLVHTPVHGLAVDLKVKEWTSFQKLKPDLPDVRSFEFCRELAKLYFSGTGTLTAPPEKSRDGDLRSRFSNWLGHELRYCEKQRHYVLAWREDLEGKKPCRKQVQLTSTFIAEPLWELLTLFHQADEAVWKDYLDEARLFKRLKNSFRDLPKYQKNLGTVDFRFTSFGALRKASVLKALAQSTEPNPSGLFLFWQILSPFSVNSYSKKERQFIQKLALTSQTNKVSASTWAAVQEICKERLSQINWTPNPLERGTFFLP